MYPSLYQCKQRMKTLNAMREAILKDRQRSMEALHKLEAEVVALRAIMDLQ